MLKHLSSIVIVGERIPAVVISVVDDLVSAADAEMVGDCIPAVVIGGMVTADDDLASAADVVMVGECIPVVVIVTLTG